jgi:putative membrane protein
MKTRQPASLFAVSLLASLGLAPLGCAESNEVANPPAQTTSASFVATAPQPRTSAAVPDMPPSPTETATLATRQTTTSLPSAQTGGATSSSFSGPAEETTLDDGQIGMIASTIDGGEIAAAKLALGKSKTPRVKQLAQHMLTEHRAIESQLQATLKSQNITPENSIIASKLNADGHELATKLGDEAGSDFDHGYVVAQIQGHQDALDMIDNRLIPNAKNSELRKALEATRAKVVSHLKMAKDIQTSLNP